MTPFWGALGIFAGLSALMLTVRALQAAGRISGEIARKMVHTGMGMVGFSLPWIFPGPWSAWLVAILVVLLLAAIRRVPALTARFGGVLGSVNRDSLGEIYYPIGVALGFSVAHQTPLVFCGAMGVLAFGDTAGAVVGTRWGRRLYAMPGGTKSVEGSLAVFLISFVCVSLALAASDAETWKSALVGGLCVGFMAAIVEGIFCRGIDNLFLPIAVVGILKLWMAREEHYGLLVACPVVAVILFLVLTMAVNRAARLKTKTQPSNSAGP